MTRDEVSDIVRRHLADELEVDAADITDATRLRDDLGADSMDLMILGQELKDVHGITLPEEEAVQVVTVGDAVDLVVRHLPSTT
ncbi:MAG: acyl carrier protein [Solirubrobacteraceae bacterium]|nr:acyl carrier protein [Solirubrobacteraceae bacterium]